MRYALAFGFAVAFATAAIAQQGPTYRNCMRALDCKCSLSWSLPGSTCEAEVTLRKQLAEHRESLRPPREAHKLAPEGATTLIASFELPEATAPSRGIASPAERRVAVIWGYRKAEIMVVHGQYDKESIEICGTDSPRCRLVRDALAALASRPLPPEATGWRVEVWGTADVAGVPDLQKYNSGQAKKACDAGRHTGNDCIAYLRALNLRDELDGLRLRELLRVAVVTIDKDPFMRNINSRVGGTLFKMLDIAESTRTLLSDLGVRDEWSAIEVRNNTHAKAKALTNYEQRLAPYRSVVLVVEPCALDCPQVK